MARATRDQRIKETRREEEANYNLFARDLEKRVKKVSSRIVLALDLDYREDPTSLMQDAARILKGTANYLCAVKLNFHLILPLSLKDLGTLNGLISSLGLTSIADLKLNDISNTNRIASQYLWKAGFSAVIANPFVGYEEGLDSLLEGAHSKGKGVIFLGYMSNKGASEGYGMKVFRGREIYQIFLERAKKWQADGVVMGSTRPEKIMYARKILGNTVKIFSPGSGAQGGDPAASLKAGADYLIFGRSIVQSPSPETAVKKIHESQLALIDNR